MTRISQPDHLLLLLQGQLQRLERDRSARAGHAGRSGKATPPPMARLKAIDTVKGLSDEELGPLLVRALLTEELGDRFVNDAGMQNILADVMRMIGESAEGRAILGRALGSLRGSG